MNCQDFENKISGYMDGELSSDEMKLFEEHIASCRQCSDLLSELQSVDEMLTGMEPPLPDEAYWSGFDARLKEKVDTVAEKRPWWNFYPLIRRNAWALIAVVIVMIAVIPILKETMLSHVMESSSQKTMAPATTQDIKEKESFETTGKETFYKSKPSLPMEEEAPEKKVTGEAPAPGAAPPSEGMAEKSNDVKNETKPDADMAASAPPKSESLTAAPRVAAKPVRSRDLKNDDGVISKPDAVITGGRTAPPLIADMRHMESKTTDREVGYSRHSVSKPKAKTGNFGRSKTEGNSVTSGKKQPEAPGTIQPVPADEDGKGGSDDKVAKLTDKVPAPPPPSIPESEVDTFRSPAVEAAPKPGGHEESPADAPDMSPSESEPDTGNRASVPSTMTESAKSAKMTAGAERKDTPVVKAKAVPCRPAGAISKSRMAIRRSMSEVNDYLATSEVVLIKLVSMPDNGVNLRNLQKQLTLSNYIEDLNRNVGKFKTDPVLERHSREMQVITNEIMTVNPKELSQLKRKVINSGIIDKTRELKK